MEKDKTIRFVLVGGFLGAGKTTAIRRLGRMYRDRGQRVGIVTNDQAAQLVDTQTLQNDGFDVAEVSGACFCCNFDTLVAQVSELERRGAPDVVIAEPVGSCTDLAATVIQPIVGLYGARFDVAPYVVLLKPSDARQALGAARQGDMSDGATYIFRKQLEEADAVIMNRCDELSANEVNELTQLVETYLRDARVGTPDGDGVGTMCVSALTGDGFDDLLTYMDQRGVFGRRLLEIDYDRYADGEAELGWLNGFADIRLMQPAVLGTFVQDLLAHAGLAVISAGGVVAHIKLIGVAGNDHTVCNLVSNRGDVTVAVPCASPADRIELTINARVTMDPTELEAQMRAAVTEFALQHVATVTFGTMQSFRPGRPIPTHRFTMPA